MNDITKLNGLKRIKTKRERMPDDAVCCVCGTPKSQTKMRRYNEYYLCAKHFQQMDRYTKITDPTPIVHKTSDQERKCCICGEIKFGTFEGKAYCRKHYIQMKRHGKIIPTIYDKNE